MKRITKLSTVAVLSLSSMVTFANAGENLADAFANGKIKGQVKAVYSNSNSLGKSTSDDITTVGGSLNYVTGDFYGLSAGATFQTSHILNEDNNNNVFSSDLDAQGSILSEVYINYKLANTSAKVGRQFIYTPLVSSAIDGKSSESLIKDSFEAYLLTNTDIPDTTLVAGYIDKYQAKAISGDTGSFEQKIGNTEIDGAYTFYVKNTSIENLTLQGQYLKVNSLTANKDIKDLYFQADYVIAGHTLSAQYLSSTDESKNNDLKDGELLGIKAQGPLGIGKLGYIIAYCSSTKDGDVNPGIGSGSDNIVFEAMPVNGSAVHRLGNTDTLIGGIITPVYNITTVAYAGKAFSDNVFGDVTAVGAIAIYPFYKNFLLKANYEHVEVEKTLAAAGVVDKNTDVTRIYLSYSF